ncbi:MAG: ATP-binding protein [Verrucomicrobia bacterium]|nr:ATP-binding protein [Verrucomicrobiota bacterium]MCH8528935.1 ATP-binding protein [Kiritimatiellia bacterium]
MITRSEIRNNIETGLRRSPVVALLGPRQCGKTTLARTFLSSKTTNYFDLEDPVTLRSLEAPKSILESLQGLVVIDEAQRRPDLFPVLRVLADREENPARFLLLGSASPDLSRQAAESLAGRVEVLEMGGFSLRELGEANGRSLWMRGGFPRSFLAKTEADSYVWRRQFIRSFLERDLGQMGFGMSPAAIGRFWTMLAHVNGQIWNASELAGSMGCSGQTARNYLDALEQTYMVRRLQPWFANLGKRVVKSPKVYIRDSGLFHALLGVETYANLVAHPKLGVSWEGYVLEQIFRVLPDEDAYFHAVHSGGELNLYLPNRDMGIEIKHNDAPSLTRSMNIVRKDLNLKKLFVVYPGTRPYTLSEDIQVLGLPDMLEQLRGG